MQDALAYSFSWLTSREKRLFNEAQPYLEQGRDWDLEHIVFSLACTREICEKEDAVAGYRASLVPAVILHDIGWSEMSPDEWANGQHATEAARRKHMRLGSKKARTLMERAGYDARTTEVVARSVGEHDNHYTGEETVEPLTRRLREIDTLWTLSRDSFSRARRSSDDPPGRVLEKMYERAQGFLVTDTAKRIAERLYRRRESEVDL